MTAHLESTRESSGTARSSEQGRLTGLLRTDTASEHKTRIYYILTTGSTRRGLHRPWERPRAAATTSAAVSPAPMACPLLCPRFTNTSHPAQTRPGWRSGTPPLPSFLHSLAAGTAALPAAKAGGRAPAGRAWEEEEESGWRKEERREGRGEGGREPGMLQRRPAPPRRRAGWQMGLRAGGCGGERGKEGAGEGRREGEETRRQLPRTMAARPPPFLACLSLPPSPARLPHPGAERGADPAVPAASPPRVSSAAAAAAGAAGRPGDTRAPPARWRWCPVWAPRASRAGRGCSWTWQRAGRGATRAGGCRWCFLRGGAGNWRGNFHFGSR